MEWRDKARAEGWSETDCDQFAAHLAMSDVPRRLVVLTSREIAWSETLAVPSLDGGPSGQVRVVERHWRRTHTPATGRRPAWYSDAPYCPQHGTACDPTTAGCGARGVISPQFCPCPRVAHRHGCRHARADPAVDTPCRCRRLEHRAGCPLGAPATSRDELPPAARAVLELLAPEATLDRELVPATPGGSGTAFDLRPPPHAPEPKRLPEPKRPRGAPLPGQIALLKR